MTCEDIEQVLLAEAAQTDSQLLNGRATPLLAAVETPTDDAKVLPNIFVHFF